MKAHAIRNLHQNKKFSTPTHAQKNFLLITFTHNYFRKKNF